MTFSENTCWLLHEPQFKLVCRCYNPPPLGGGLWVNFDVKKITIMSYYCHHTCLYYYYYIWLWLVAADFLQSKIICFAGYNVQLHQISSNFPGLSMCSNIKDEMYVLDVQDPVYVDVNWFYLEMHNIKLNPKNFRSNTYINHT